MKYDARACHFNMDTGCVELLLRDGRKISIDCTGVEDALDVTMAQQTELDYLIYNDPLGYADLILNGNLEGPRVRVPGGAPQQQNPNFFPIGEGFGFFVFFGKQNEGSFPAAVCPKPYSHPLCRG